MTDLDLLGTGATAALQIVGTTELRSRRLMQKVLLLLLGPEPTGYDLLAKLRGASGSDLLQHHLDLGRETALDGMDLRDRLAIRELAITVSNYEAANAAIDITLATSTETAQSTVTL